MPPASRHPGRYLPRVSLPEHQHAPRRHFALRQRRAANVALTPPQISVRVPRDPYLPILRTNPRRFLASPQTPVTTMTTPAQVSRLGSRLSLSPASTFLALLRGNNLSKSIGASSAPYSKHSAISASLIPPLLPSPFTAADPPRNISSTARRTLPRTFSRCRDTLDSCSPKTRPISANFFLSA